jgi:hypothetical protein
MLRTRNGLSATSLRETLRLLLPCRFNQEANKLKIMRSEALPAIERTMLHVDRGEMPSSTRTHLFVDSENTNPHQGLL